MNVEITSLSDIQKAAIAKYISDVVPESFKEYVTPANLDATLKLMQVEILYAQQHNGLASAQAFLNWIDSTKKEDQVQPAEQSASISNENV